MPNANRSIGSDPSNKQMWDAIATSMGVKAKMSTAKRNSSSFNGAGRSPSMEGLDSSRSAWVQPNGSGYSHVRKRGARVPADLVAARPSTLRTKAIRSAGMVDYTRGATGSSSIARLAKLTKFNRMF